MIPCHIIGISNISTHDLTKRSTTAPQQLQPNHSHFNSRPHEEVDHTRHNTKLLQFHFNSRPHEEVDLHRQCKRTIHTYFNSRPHEEVDQGQVLKWALDFVFQLTTSQGGRHSANIHLAPHFLFQLTTSQGGRRFLSGVKTKRKMYFNSRPRKEVDQRQLRIGLNDQIISTHDLARRSTKIR